MLHTEKFEEINLGMSRILSGALSFFDVLKHGCSDTFHCINNRSLIVKVSNMIVVRENVLSVFLFNPQFFKYDRDNYGDDRQFELLIVTQIRTTPQSKPSRNIEID